MPEEVCSSCGQRIPRKLTRTQYVIASMLAEGMNLPQIAQERRCKMGTVKFHLHEIYRKVGLLRDPQRLPHIQLAVYWHCELFQIGLKANA